MLELLASHAIYNASNPGSPVATLTDLASGSFAFYDDGLGLCSRSASLGGYCIVQLDGAAYLRSAQASATAYTVDLQRPQEYLAHAPNEDALYLWNKGPGTLGSLVIAGSTNDFVNLEVRTPDRYLSALFDRIKFKPLDNSAALVEEAIVTGIGSGARPTWSRTNDPDVLAIVWPDGWIAYYNVETRAQVGRRGYIGANLGAWYSRKHDVFIAISPANEILVYASAVRPSALSNPVATTPITQGRVSEVKVRLLGANSDPCADELVDWSITAGGGELAQAQSTTDADGYAVNDYIAPVTGGAGSPFGGVTIHAQVLF